MAQPEAAAVQIYPAMEVAHARVLEIQPVLPFRRYKEGRRRSGDGLRAALAQSTPAIERPRWGRRRAALEKMRSRRLRRAGTHYRASTAEPEALSSALDALRKLASHPHAAASLLRHGALQAALELEEPLPPVGIFDDVSYSLRLRI